MAADPVTAAREQISRRLAELHRDGPRLSPLDLHARMDAIAKLAAVNGLAALERLAGRSAQLALLPGHRVTMRCCLEHIEAAFDSRSEGDCNSILAALAVRLH
ncbi:MAG TPA: hypothetical protein VM265_04050 [Sphingomicrobium sp.]|nr:hypothetical protein [Sphingomicrobium sp.]